MTYKEYYLTLKSPEDIKRRANADMAFSLIENPERMAVIRKSAEEAIKEKFGIVEEEKGDEE